MNCSNNIEKIGKAKGKYDQGRAQSAKKTAQQRKSGAKQRRNKAKSNNITLSQSGRHNSAANPLKSAYI